MIMTAFWWCVVQSEVQSHGNELEMLSAYDGKFNLEKDLLARMSKTFFFYITT
jgi:hypothetical protein